ncbi:pentapeptide repeat-containing protein [Streptomyces sp. E-08]|uniref:pentapeptide repeat-containing protein n=1 Tax=Streptomyces sp. E-08 TaxID=3404047 RepID=UPI003CEE1A61
MRLGGIYALQRIMQDSVRDHSTVVSVLAAYVRQHAPLPGEGTRPQQTALAEPAPPAEVQAAMTVLANRLPSRDTGPALELQRTDLRGLKFRIATGHRLAFRGAAFSFARLNGAVMANSDLRDALLDGADLREAQLFYSDLTGAYMAGADLTDTLICAQIAGTGVTDQGQHRCASMERATPQGATLTDVDLSGAELPRADLRGADLSGADLRHANLTGADLTDADITGAKLAGAKLKGVRGLRTSQP